MSLGMAPILPVVKFSVTPATGRRLTRADGEKL